MSNNPRKNYNHTRRFMIAHFTHEVLTGQRFKVWPEHATLYPWFETTEPDALSRFIRADEILRNFPVDRKPRRLGKVVMFGPEGTVPVRRIGEDTSLGFMHGVLVGIFDGLEPDRTYMGGAYNPHVSEVVTDYPDPSVEVVVDSMCLVMRQRGNWKKILGAERF